MCSGAGDDGVVEMERKLVSTNIENRCKKCGTDEGFVVLRAHDIYCKNCFIPYFVHKFRSCLGKSKLMKANDVVVVAYSGGAASTALVHMIKDALEEDNKKKLKYTTLILYIDESALGETDRESRKIEIERVLNQLNWCQFPVYVTNLEMLFKSKDEDDSMVSTIVPSQEFHLPADDDAESKLKNLFSSVTTLTAKEDLLYRLRHQVICKVAKQLKATKVFLGDSATRLANRLLTDIAQGRIADLTEDIAFSHNRMDDALVLRPMRDYMGKEIAFYNIIHKLQYTELPTLGTKTDQRSSISRLTESFLQGLQAEFPATTSTIFRTGDKLCTDHKLDIAETCILCKGRLDTCGKESSDQNDVNSRTCQQTGMNAETNSCCNGSCTNNEVNDVSLLESSCKNDRDERQKLPTNSTCCSSKYKFKEMQVQEKLSKEDVSTYACYGCKLIIKDMTDIVDLPSDIFEEIRFRDRRNHMRNEIAEFLLDDDDS